MICSSLQTKEWRMEQEWYKRGKSLECEKWQLLHLEKIVGASLQKTHKRMNLFDFRIEELKHPLERNDGFEWSENFDFTLPGPAEIFFNLKFISGSGGAQTRSIREVYHFVRAQCEYVKRVDTGIFCNILDGDFCFAHCPKIALVLERFQVGTRIFVGDTLSFSRWFKENNICEMNKKQLGQYYTTRFDRVLDGLRPVSDLKVVVIEPFAGEGHLIKWLNNFDDYKTELYDIEPKRSEITKRDTLKYPPDYDGKFILTNPPFLARNKSKSKELFDMYKTDDLYKCFLKHITKKRPVGGILILPLNFWCSNRKNDVSLRKDFLSKFEVDFINVFEEAVFEDTKYSVCSFSFRLNEKQSSQNELFFTFHKSGERKELRVSIYNCIIAGELYDLPSSGKYKLGRLVAEEDEYKTNIVVKCIDDSERISARVVRDEEVYIDMTKNKSARSYMTLTARPQISLEMQVGISNKFNSFLEEKRLETNSLFLTNYREDGRKRISFDMIYKIVSYLLDGE